MQCEPTQRVPCNPLESITKATPWPRTLTKVGLNTLDLCGLRQHTKRPGPPCSENEHIFSRSNSHIVRFSDSDGTIVNSSPSIGDDNTDTYIERAQQGSNGRIYLCGYSYAPNLTLGGKTTLGIGDPDSNDPLVAELKAI